MSGWPWYLLKLAISAGLIVLVSEIAKRSTLTGALIAAIPTVSLLAILWIYFETADLERIARLSTDIFWLVLPSLALFVVLPLGIRQGFGFWPSLLAGIVLTAAGYGLIAWWLGGHRSA